MPTRDFDNEHILDKMREMKTTKDLELLKTTKNSNKGLNSKNLEDRENKVLNIKYLGNVNLGEKADKENKKDIYLITEQRGNTIIEGYYTDELELIAADRNDDDFKQLIATARYTDKADILEQLQALDKEGKLDLDKIEDERLEELSDVLGVSSKEIKEVREISLEEQEISKDNLSGLNIKEETNANTYLKGSTLRNKLGLGGDVVKIAIVSTSSLNKATNDGRTTQDSFVAIKANGEAIVLGEDILRADRQAGNNPRNRDITIENDGSVDKESVTSSYLIVNGNGREYLQIGYDETSGKEIKYTTRELNGKKEIDVELETNRTWPRNSKVREFLNDRGNGEYEPEKIGNNAEKLKVEEGKEDVSNIDTDRDNDSKNPLTLNDNYLDECVRKIMENDEVQNVFTENEVREMVGKNVNNADYRGMELEERMEKIEENIITDAQNLERERR